MSYAFNVYCLATTPSRSPAGGCRGFAHMLVLISKVGLMAAGIATVAAFVLAALVEHYASLSASAFCQFSIRRRSKLNRDSVVNGN